MHHCGVFPINEFWSSEFVPSCNCAWGHQELEEVERTMLSLLIPDGSAQPDAEFVKSQKHWLMFTFSCKGSCYTILLYQMSYGAATPRHLVHSINKYCIILHECVFFVTCLKWPVWITVLGPPNRAGSMADSKQVAAKHQQSLQFVSEGLLQFYNNLHWVARVAECTSFLEVLIILRFSLHFVPANSVVTYSVQAHCRKSRRTVNKRCMGCNCAGQKAVGRGREDDVEPSDSRRSAQPDAEFVKSQKHWLMFRFLVKKLLYFYQMSYGAATPRHLVHSINKYCIILHECVFFFVTCLN